MKTPQQTAQQTPRHSGRPRTASSRRLFPLAGACLLAAVTLTACGGGASSSGSAGGSTSPGGSMSMSASAPSSDPSSSGGGAASSSTQASITIKDFRYAAPSSVEPGQTVMVTNDDTEAHTVTADQGNAFGVTVAPGKTVSFKAPEKPGSYAFHCEYHSNMHGTLVVK